ncbi:unnamed protein product [Malus baccata var. baccata]
MEPFPLRPSKFSFEYLLLPPRSAPTAAPPGLAPQVCGDRRALLLIGAWRLPRRPGVGRALQRHPFSGLVDSAVSLRASTRVSSGFARSGHRFTIFRVPDRHARTRPFSEDQDSLVRVSRRAEWGARRPTPGARSAEARLDGARCPPRARRRRLLGLTTARALAVAAIRVGPRPEPIGGPACDRSTSDRGASPAPIRFPSRQFQALFDSLFKVLFIFPSRYLFAIGLSPVFSLGQNLPPDWGCIPNNPDSPTAPRGATGSGHNGALTLSGATFQWTWARSAAEDASPDYNSNADGARFSSWRVPGSLAVTRGILACPRPDGFGRNLRSKTRWFTGFCNSHQVSHFATFFIDARAEISVAESRFDISKTTTHPPRTVSGAAGARSFVQIPWRSTRRCSFVRPSRDEGDAGPEGPPTPDVETGSRVVLPCRFDNDPSAGSPTETLLRLLLPLNDKVQWTSRDVAGSEPPASPRSEHFTGPFNW